MPHLTELILDHCNLFPRHRLLRVWKRVRPTLVSGRLRLPLAGHIIVPHLILAFHVAVVAFGHLFALASALGFVNEPEKVGVPAPEEGVVVFARALIFALAGSHGVIR